MRQRMQPCGLALLAVLMTTPAAAQPRQLRLSVMGSAATDWGLAWTSPQGQAGALVQLGLGPDRLDRQLQGQVTPVGPGFGDVGQVTIHGLQPATRYHYRVGRPGRWSRVRSFRTAPAEHPQCGALRFLVSGDSRAEGWQGDQGASTIWARLVPAMVRDAPDLVLHTGDIVHDGRRLAQWASHLQVSEPLTSRVPLMIALGNHDDGPGQGEGAAFNRVLHLPRAERALGGDGVEDYYAFTAANAIFVALSTCSFDGGEVPFARQARWLDRVLSRNPKRWRIVYLHHPVQTERVLVGHAPNEVRQNRALVPVFNRHGVDLVLQGHNHFYERWAPTRCPAGLPCTDHRGGGPIYITTGGGGAFPIFQPGGVGGERRAASGAHHYMRVALLDGWLWLSAVDASGQVIDRLTVHKPAAAGREPCTGASATARQRARRWVMRPSSVLAKGAPGSGACSVVPGAAAAGLPLYPLLLLCGGLLLRGRRGRGKSPSALDAHSQRYEYPSK